jgi:Dipeptidyl peptidase IV (DPP IV) N-terminal region
MRHLFKVSVFLGICIFLLACGLASQGIPSPVPSQMETSTPKITIVPSQTPTNTLKPTPTRTYNPPTLIPTLDPTSVPRLLKEALLVQTMEGVNGHKMQQITGWDYGFRQFPDNGYHWLNSKHLLLYPRTGEEMKQFMDGSRREDSSFQPVIMNLESGHPWLPWSNTSTSVYFSRELGIIFQQQLYSSATGPTQESVVTYTFDGQEIARYWGKILGVSPTGTKILVDDDTIIDLRDNKIIDLAWYMDYDLEMSSKLYWSSDETRVYRCCFYFADLRTGKSYNFEWSDMRGVDGKSVSFSMQPHVDGQWVRNDTYFLVKWDYWTVSYGDPIPLFSPIEKKYYDLAEMAGIPTALTANATYTVSPNGMYVWIKSASEADGIIHNFFVNLVTFETVTYDVDVIDVEWSPDSQFVGLGVSPFNGPSEIQLFSVSSKKTEPLPLGSLPLWRPKDHVFAYLAGDTLELTDAQTRSTRELPLPTAFRGLVWSPNDDHIALIADNGSLWQVDYPNLENLEQLTPPLPTVSYVNWSPNGDAIAFISDADIYIVETTK